MLGKLRNKAFTFLLNHKTPGLYQFCKRYIDEWSGNNNCNFHSNGESYLLTLYNNKIRRGVIFDVGASVGDYSRMLLDFNDSLHIFCFEPSKATFSILASQSWPENVVLNNFALDESGGEKPLFLSADGSGLNSFYKRTGLEIYGLKSFETSELVKTETLDNYCIQKNIDQIDLLKVDVERHELAVFKGARNMLSKGRIKQIQFEYGGCNIDSRVLLKDIFEYFQDLDYSFYKLFPKELRPIKLYNQTLENF